MSIRPGHLVTYREREWVVLPSEDSGLVLLRPIGGSQREVCGVLKPLADEMAYSLSYERIIPAQFPLPDPEVVQDHAAVRLTMESARLLLREGAAPFRSLGRLSIRPRPYQFVPLLMALRMDTVRLLIADDVGVGKTIEGALIARELLDRGEVHRIVVLCPPHLCDQWQKELAEKFQIEAVTIRSATISRLERNTPPDRSVFEYYPHIIASIDLVKSERYRPAFLQHCPQLVIVDEVHGAAEAPAGRQARAQQQRHELLKDLAQSPGRHLILLTATPHSGVETSFLSILALLKQQFRDLNLAQLSDTERSDLARHFIQRRRADVKRWMGEETRFPERENVEQPYAFSEAYRSFYEAVYEFASAMVRSAEGLTGWKRRMRFWSALALLRCITSSPAAAHAALAKRAGGGPEDTETGEFSLDLLEATTEEELDASFKPVVSDPQEAEAVSDAPPGSVFEAQKTDPDWPQADRQRLNQFARMAQSLRGEADTKLKKVEQVAAELLEEGYHPIVWCRYIATSDYVAEVLQVRLRERFPNLRVVSVTGADSEEERRVKVEDLVKSPRRVLVATDCLSEGVNLQEHFNAVVHYDLPWNPNRLEQREGRVDRFGQPAEKVKAVLIYGQDNPVDGAVLEVLLRKTREIHRSLGVHVPVPINSETILETVMQSLFARARYEDAQLHLFHDSEETQEQVRTFHQQWDRAAEREKESRTRFAQKAISPEEVERELKETDNVLGDPARIHLFIQEASQRLGFGFRQAGKDIWEVQTTRLPELVRLRLDSAPEWWRITFKSPMPERVPYIGRNHPLVEGLAELLLDQAFHSKGEEALVARCGVVRTRQVTRRTTLLLLRLRFLIYEGQKETPTLAEETLPWGFEGLPPDVAPLALADAQALLDSASADQNIPAAEKSEVVAETLGWWDDLQPKLQGVLQERTQRLEETHRRIRRVLHQPKIHIEAQRPPDLLGVLALLPVAAGVKR